ncbi:MAG: sensor histidine kinase [Chloroflexi bacterium]|nr:sensor histidine kinase [Chloroflexota bacterium]
MDSRYERNIFLFLSLYRFLAYGLAVVLIQTVPLGGEEDTLSGQDYTLLSGFGVYTLFKILGPLRWREEGLMTYIMLGGDLLLATVAVLLTGGLNSGFLLYALTPILTGSLLFTETLAIATAIVTSASLAIAHLLLYRWVDKFVWIMEENNLLWLIVFNVTTFLFASVVYRTNLNIRRRIETDAVADERQHTKRELHDGIIQTIGYLSLKTQTVSALLTAGDKAKALEGLDEMHQTVQDAYRDARENLDQLSVEIGEAELVQTLRDYVESFSERYGIQVSLEVPGEEIKFTPLASLQILRVTQEALTNVRKHSQATEARVILQPNGKGLDLLIRDNGSGFDLEGFAANGKGHYGLQILGERAESLGGTLNINSSPGGGTEVKVNLPKRVRVR